MSREMFSCPLQAFMRDYAPKVDFNPDNFVDKTIAKLKDIGVLSQDGSSWVRFPKKPSQCDGVEQVVFSPLQEIWNGVTAVAKDNGLPKSRLRYLDRPYNVTISETGGSTHQVDGYLGLGDEVPCVPGDNPDDDDFGSIRIREEKLTAHTAVPKFYKKAKNASDVHDNRLQNLTGAIHLMDADPCRKWLYSITIEDEDVTLWYWSRSHSVKSSSFNFRTDIRQFIKVMLTFMLATPEQLGFDPAIQRFRDGNQFYYVYADGKRFYKTIRSIYEQHTLCISSRATRVWEAVEIKSLEDHTAKRGKKQVVIRDYWIDEDARTEGQIQQLLFKDIDVFASEAKKDGSIVEFPGCPADHAEELRDFLRNRKYRALFLTILHERHASDGDLSEAHSDDSDASDSELDEDLWDSDVDPNEASSPDTTDIPDDHQTEDINPDDWSMSKSLSEEAFRVSDLFDKPVVPLAPALAESKGRGKSSSTPINQESKVRTNPRYEGRRFSRKRRTWVIYKELCDSAHDMTTMAKFMKAVRDCLIGIRIMWFARWIHRDISTGNILGWMDSDGKVQGKLSDLEYARHINDKSSGQNDPKTGTAFFMAIEIHQSHSLYILSPANVGGPASQSAPVFEIQQRLQQFTEETKGVNNKRAAVASPEVVHHEFIHDVESFFWVALWAHTDDVDHPLSREWAEGVFDNSYVCSLQRVNVFTRHDALMTALNAHLHPSFQRVTLQTELEGARSVLADTYHKELPPHRPGTDKSYLAVLRLADICLAGATVAYPDLLLLGGKRGQTQAQSVADPPTSLQPSALDAPEPVRRNPRRVRKDSGVTPDQPLSKMPRRSGQTDIHSDKH